HHSQNLTVLETRYTRGRTYEHLCAQVSRSTGDTLGRTTRTRERRGGGVFSLKRMRDVGHRTGTGGRKLPRHERAVRVGAIALLATVAGIVAGCGSSSSSSSASNANGKATIRVAVVSNSNMVDIEKLTP